MDGSLVLRGFVIGLSLAAPVGPIGVLTIRRTLAHGRLTGFISGLGTATADGLYGLIGALGLTAVTTLLTGNIFWLKLVGGLFLCYLGVQTLRAKPAVNPAQAQSRQGLVGAYVSALLLTLTNPMTILAFVAIFTSLLAGDPHLQGADTGNLILIVLGVFLGSSAWWLILSTVTSLLRNRLNPQSMRWVNIVSGLVIGGFGIVAIVNGLVAR